MHTKPLGAYSLYGNQQIRLTTNPGGSWEIVKPFDKGSAITEAGWILIPSIFNKYHPGFCLFSKLEQVVFENRVFVKAWLYSPVIRDEFKTEQGRNLFCCFVDNSCLYQLMVI